MIIDFDKCTPEIITTMNSSLFQFQLTGSRYFGNFKPNSDWDFFAKDSEELMSWLKDLGFEIDVDSSYNDVCCCRVMRGNFPHGGNVIQVDVQLVDDVQLKTLAQKVINDKVGVFNLSSMDKKELKALWNGVLLGLKELRP